MKAEFRPPYSKDRKPLQELLPLNTPLAIYIDPTNICNFSCVFCFNGNANLISKMNKATMSMETFRKLVEDMKLFPTKIKIAHLHGYGEPLLNKNVPSMIKILKSEQVVERVATTSNGSALTKENIEAVIKAGLDQIHISIYGLSQDDYIKITGNKCNYIKLIENIKLLYQLKENCHVHIKIIGEYLSELQKQEFLNTFGDYCDTIFIDNVANIWPEFNVNEVTGQKEIKHQYSHQFTSNQICPQIFYQMLVNADGRVSPCCVDYAQEVIIGDAKSTSIVDIWNSDYLHQMRIDHLNGEYKKYEGCKNCQYPMVGSSVDITPFKEQLIEMYQHKN